MTVETYYKRELRYLRRMLDEPWRRVGLHISAVCRCEQATPCFDHVVYIADLREEATETDDAQQREKKQAEATELYLKLTRGEK